MDGEGFLIRVHSVIPRSSVNGPGRRLVVFFQGCLRRCPGCFNPDTHPIDSGRPLSAGEVLSSCRGRDVEGITVSGGEPFLQPAPLLELLKTARRVHGLTTMVYTGFDYGELRADPALSGPLEYIDVLIDGPFDSGTKEPTLLARGSTNQGIHLLGDAYTLSDLYMPGKAELIIGGDGRVVSTGFSQVPMPPG